MNVLVIDSDRDMLRSIAQMIDNWGGSVDCAPGARLGMLRISEKIYDYILLDLNMAGEDGFWFMQRADIPSSTKVVAMGGLVPGMMLREIYRLGVCDFIEKPFSQDELLDVFERHGANRSLEYEEPEVCAA